MCPEEESTFADINEVEAVLDILVISHIFVAFFLLNKNHFTI
jgi:uncharacterized protein (DUF983 family)